MLILTTEFHHMDVNDLVIFSYTLHWSVPRWVGRSADFRTSVASRLTSLIFCCNLENLRFAAQIGKYPIYLVFEIYKDNDFPPSKQKDTIHRGLYAGGVRIAQNQTHVIATQTSSTCNYVDDADADDDDYLDKCNCNANIKHMHLC